MLTTKINNDQKFNIGITNQDAASDTNFYYNNLLTKAGISVINKPFDTELYEYKPKSDTVNYFIYFLSFKDTTFNQDITNNIEPAFADYLKAAKSKLSGDKTKLTPFDFQQANDNISIPAQKDFYKTSAEIVKSKPYQVTDFVHEFNKLLPIKPGLPLFYDTFTFPFSHMIDTWKNLTNKYSDSAALYNSFLLMDFYTSNDPTVQQKILSIPVFVVDRYMMYERSVNEVKQLRPSFLLKDGVEGYSMFFLKNFGINKLYVRYSFWDAMNGAKIPLLPSSIHTTYKKGVQSVSDFDHRNEYLMFDLNFDDQSYRMYEFNNASKLYDIQTYDFDLYELFYDDYWAGKTVKNTRPIPLAEPDSFIINFNQTIDLTINNTIINKDEKLYRSPIDDVQLQGYYSNFYKDEIGTNTKNYLKYVFPNLTQLVPNEYFKENILYVDDNGIEHKSRSYQKVIETIKITNNNNNKVFLYDIFIGDMKLSHTPTHNVTLTDNTITPFNNKMIDDIAIKTKTTQPSKQQVLFVENYATYTNLGFPDMTTPLISDLYMNMIDFFKSDYNVNLANTHSIYEKLDLDKTNVKSLAWYFIQNYVFSRNGQIQYNTNRTGKGNTNGNEIYFDSITNYYQILKDYSVSDPNINKLKFKNLSVVKQNEFLDAKFNLIRTANYQRLSKDISFYKNEAYWFTPTQISEISNHLQSNETAIQQINKNFESLDKQKHKIWLRDCMVGLNISYNDENLSLDLNETVDFKVNFFLGEQFAINALNYNNNLIITATIKIILADRYNNRKIYTIPVNYKLQII